MLREENCKNQNISESGFNVTDYVTSSWGETCDVHNHIFCAQNILL